MLWALDQGPSYRSAVLAAVNLGGDADVHGALVGLLAGALHGHAVLPLPWRTAVARPDWLAALSDGLLAAALERIAEG